MKPKQLEMFMTSPRYRIFRVLVWILATSVFTYAWIADSLTIIIVPTLVITSVYIGLTWGVRDQRRLSYHQRELALLASYVFFLSLSVTAEVLDHTPSFDKFTNIAINTYLFLSLIGMTGLVINDILTSKTITIRALVSGMFGYVNLALAWVHLYVVLYALGYQVLDPIIGKGNGADSLENYFDLIYYSMVTLTTLGFGDYSPVGTLPRMATALEAIVGQFYIAILIGSLLGMYLRDRERE